MEFTRKNVRLVPQSYRGCGWFFVTFCCWRRRPVFKYLVSCSWFLEFLRQESAAHSFAVHAYCLMPDHVHLLVEGMEPASDLLRFLKSLKQKSAFQFEKKTGNRLWQKKFYDHILRPTESPDGVAWYIWMNPVRKGLCAQPEEYPFLGSFTGAWPVTTRPSDQWLPSWKKPKMPA
ncbi:MAG: transposase [Candidatus Acidiferrales bacterium]